MKRTIAILLALVFCLSLCACGKGNNTPEGDPSASSNTEFKTETDNTGNPDGTTNSESTNNTAHTENTQNTEIPEDTKVPENTEADEDSNNTENNEPAHTHTWVNATCTKAKTCSTCNATEGSAAGHNWKAATCTTVKTCSVCNATEGNPNGHSWKDATCTTPKTCATCNATEGSVGAHRFANGVCAVCNAVDSINPKGNLKMNVEYLGYFRVLDEELHASALQFAEEGCFVTERYFSREDTGSIYVEFEGTRYYSVGGGFSPYHYQSTDTELIITSVSYNDDTGIASIKAIMLSNGTLKITYSTNSAFPVGTILSTNIDDVI